MRKRRKLMVYSHFQLKKSILAGLAAFLICGFFSSGFIYISLANNASLNRVQLELQKTDNPSAAQSRPDESVGEEIAGVRSMGLIIISLSAVLCLVAGCGVFLLTLKNTSGVSGQMVLLGNYLDLLGEGIKPHVRHLRKDDSFHFVFEKLAAYIRNMP